MSWLIIKDDRPVAKERDCYLAMLVCLGMKADGITDDPEDRARFIDAAECRLTFERRRGQ